MHSEQPGAALGSGEPVPPGYRPGYAVRYPRVALQVAAAATAVVAVPAFLALAWLLQRPEQRGGLPIVLSGGWPVLVAVLTIPVHELAHGLAMRLLGYRVTYGFHWRMLAAYAIAPGQHQRWEHALAIALTPLVALSVVALALLAAPDRSVATVGFVALVVNTVGSVGDVYFASRLLRVPRRSLLRDVSPEETLVCEPGP